MQERSEVERRAMWPCLNVTTWRMERSDKITIKFDHIPFDPCNSTKRFHLCPSDQKNSTYLQPPIDVIDTKVITNVSVHFKRSSRSQNKLKQRENDSHWAQYMRLKELFELELNHSLNTWLQDNL